MTTSCKTAGGGGATIVYMYEGLGTAQTGKLILVGPGGGGGGIGISPHNPDYNENTNANSGPDCPKFKGISSYFCFSIHA